MYNNVYKQSIINDDNIYKLDLSDYRLCEFTDAKDYFTCSISDWSKDKAIICIRYILSQKGNFE